jgi:hypothetical protein
MCFFLQEAAVERFVPPLSKGRSGGVIDETDVADRDRITSPDPSLPRRGF